ncbi:MAG: trypsin-like peptidase domain-containing protein [Prevotellaceae bacterium]|jgi:Do/DeqQ family serine protease|nr:trypsin-like peptidase domain-containing protein [Prevotellaceae bacterium]
MKKTTRNILAVAAIVLLSSGVAGLTTYQMTRTNQQNAAGAPFDQVFMQNPNVHAAGFTGTAEQPVDLTKAAEMSVHAVVHIRSTQAAKTQEVEVRDPFSDFFDFFGGGRGGTQRRQIETPPRTGFGSGVIISKDGYIVTNNHVIANADEISVTLNDNRIFKGRIIGTDEDSDLALIKIEGGDFPTIPVGDSDALKLGEWVLAIGNPFNLTSTVTAGIVSAKARSLDMPRESGKQGIEAYIQTDAAINAGNSGGALVNVRGELVGINALLYSPTGSNTGYGFAIPTSIMKKVVADLKEYGTVQRVKLGVSVTVLADQAGDTQYTEKESGKKLSDVKQEARDNYGVVDGLWVREIVEGGSAASSDIKVNDVIIGIDGKEIHKFADLQEILAKHRPGDKVNVKLMRDKKAKTVEVVLKNEQGNTKVVKSAGMDILGAAFKPVSDNLKKQLNLGYGLEVTGVTSGKMSNAGIRKGFIILKANGVQMKNVDDLQKVLKEATKSPDQVLFITGMFPSGKRASYAVDLSQE